MFTIQADSHLDQGMRPALYERTLANALADQPDFHIDLGDTFMTDKYPNFKDALPQYFAQRYYFGRIAHSAPLVPRPRQPRRGTARPLRRHRRLHGRVVLPHAQEAFPESHPRRFL